MSAGMYTIVSSILPVCTCMCLYPAAWCLVLPRPSSPGHVRCPCIAVERAMARRKCIVAASVAAAAAAPFFAVDPVLTPYFPNGTLNLALVPAQAEACVQSGVSIVLLGGSNGEWPSLSVEERLLTLTAWTTALQTLKSRYASVPSLMFHVGHTDVSAAVVLAQAAESAAVDSILSVAPGIIFTATATDPTATVRDLARIAAAAPTRPLYYYHYPSLYQVDLPMAAFVPSAQASIPTFKGVKYIDTKYADFVSAAVNASASGRPIDWFPESQFLLPTLPYGGNGSPAFTWSTSFLKDIYTAYAAGNGQAAAAAQARMLQLDAIVGAFGGTTAARALYKAVFGLDLGPIRPPQTDLTQAQVQALVQQMREGGFIPANMTLH